jgi:hypothetical protein
MRGARLALAFLVVAAFLLVLWKTQPPRPAAARSTNEAVTPAPPPSPGTTVSASRATATPEPAASPAATGTPLARTRSGLPLPPPAPAEMAAAEEDLHQVQLMLRQFRAVLGENPIGTNAEIMLAVRGQNLQQARIGAPEGLVLNEHGELLDRWGTPYFFHALAKDEMEVRSAGPDRTLWTGDDVVLK